MTNVTVRVGWQGCVFSTWPDWTMYSRPKRSGLWEEPGRVYWPIFSCVVFSFQSVKRLIGIEITESAVEDAKVNAELNGRANYSLG